MTYFFKCSCGMESESLGQDYIRLKAGVVWVCAGCLDEKAHEKVKEFKGGYLVKEVDF